MTEQEIRANFEASQVRAQVADRDDRRARAKAASDAFHEGGCTNCALYDEYVAISAEFRRRWPSYDIRGTD